MTKSIATIFSLSLIIFSSQSWANALMTKAQYADYSVQYQCADINFHNDMNKKEAELIRIENSFGLNDDNFDAFDDLITEYERDDALLDTIRSRSKTECSTANIASNS
ncbi:MAG: hypothetical protein ACJAWS_002887 [Oleiphilaceae bacterium]|jgi:hypothetical protein